MKKNLFLLIFLACLSAQTWAEDNREKKSRHLFGGLNMVAYRGSLQDSYLRWTPALQTGLSIGVRKNLNLVFGLTFGKVIGEDRNYRLPSGADISLNPVNRFQTSFASFAAEMQFKAFEYKGFRLLGSLGLGLMHFTPRDFEGNDLAPQIRTRNRSETYAQNALQFPLQLIAQYWFKPGLGIGFQGGWLNVNSRYLDNMDELAGNSRGDNVAVFRFLVMAGL